ncbi:hypothetical protein H112_01642 [Trichophyton rubrum D6]|uniref:Uncharacterized protein n=1 Tax=Trichophyton rubrum CBS 288.86 TaxID=1215330 RepID=A0A022WBT8_TRIRU|nr:hypothetical protein H100_01640 [Trichophyton rubrum MR850]EZF45225.1 hypothetical protein H102_01632 [Trichophyton rubrum CBS 100081]EZF55875.1 hypothetical protein H103_01646 [Trichophyton rubrum CBS 288.86]EZF66492.1 hypothetical protein H104_01621 [Trichophyton rubrum CBS 289.86]EZF87753.1 hypothetical protein H110_01644 [Trichophyton rubrum MR1448]EZF98550.1 hypothetical protein H113_01643 [Trichophyton rubrum MR1459]EZG09520.1 hypothetical protein H106_01411 [Trichophyton rubrum CBS 
MSDSRGMLLRDGAKAAATSDLPTAGNSTSQIFTPVSPRGHASEVVVISRASERDLAACHQLHIKEVKSNVSKKVFDIKGRPLPIRAVLTSAGLLVQLIYEVLKGQLLGQTKARDQKLCHDTKQDRSFKQKEKNNGKTTKTKKIGCTATWKD